MRISKFPQLRLPWLWGPITLRANLRLKWGLKKSFSPYREFSNSISHTTYTQGNWDDSRLLMVESQIDNSFDHNLCFKCPNGSCEPILNIYVLRDFHWYKEVHNPMGFDPCDHFLKIWKFDETPTPKVGAHLGVWRFIPSHSPTLPGFPLGPHPCKPLPWSWAQG